MAEAGAGGGTRDGTQGRVSRPTRSGCAPFYKKRGHGHEDCGHDRPIRHHVQKRKRHVPRSNLERDEEVSEGSDERQRHEEKNHDRAVHGHQR